MKRQIDILQETHPTPNKAENVAFSFLDICRCQMELSGRRKIETSDITFITTFVRNIADAFTVQLPGSSRFQFLCLGVHANPSMKPVTAKNTLFAQMVIWIP